MFRAMMGRRSELAGIDLWDYAESDWKPANAGDRV